MQNIEALAKWLRGSFAVDYETPHHLLKLCRLLDLIALCLDSQQDGIDDAMDYAIARIDAGDVLVVASEAVAVLEADRLNRENHGLR